MKQNIKKNTYKSEINETSDYDAFNKIIIEFVLGYSFTEKEFIEACISKKVIMNGLEYEYNVELDEEGHLSSLNISAIDGSLDCQITYTWNPNLTIELPDDIHVHDDSCADGCPYLE